MQLLALLTLGGYSGLICQHILISEIKCCSKLHFTVAQPQLVLNLFLDFLTNFEAHVLIKLFF